MVLSGISPSFPGLFQTRRQVTHALLTRAPLEYPPKGAFPYDLHVLGTPPAFVLSQDQTLQFELGERQHANASPLFSHRPVADREGRSSSRTAHSGGAGGAERFDGVSHRFGCGRSPRARRTLRDSVFKERSEAPDALCRGAGAGRACRPVCPTRAG